MTVVVDTSALFALLDRSDAHHAAAAAWWACPDDDDLVTHAYVVVEAAALVRARLGWAGLVALLDGLVPALRVEMVERAVHDSAVAAVRGAAGTGAGAGTSLVDRVTIEFASANGIGRAFAFDRDLVAAGLAPVAPASEDPAVAPEAASGSAEADDD